MPFEHPLKNAYIGEVYEYSYDFRNKSTSQITADGWVVNQGGCSFSSYGVRSNSSDRMLKLLNNVSGLGTKMANCKNLVIEFTRYTTGQAAFSGYLIKDTIGTNSTGMYNDNRLGDTNLKGGGDTLISLSTTISGQVKFRGEYDLVNKTVEFSWNGANTRTATLTDTEVTNIRTTNSIYVYFRGNPSTSNLGGFSDISITIEN